MSERRGRADGKDYERRDGEDKGKLNIRAIVVEKSSGDGTLRLTLSKDPPFVMRFREKEVRLSKATKDILKFSHTGLVGRSVRDVKEVIITRGKEKKKTSGDQLGESSIDLTDESAYDEVKILI